jgi:hypothetical protein
MESVVAAAGSVAGRAELPQQLTEPMQRQLELLQEIVERERRLQREIAGRLVAPIDAVFDLLSESAVTLRKQSEAMESAGRALEQSAALVGQQADLFERTVTLLREPTELAKAAAGLERKPRSRSRKKK